MRSKSSILIFFILAIAVISYTCSCAPSYNAKQYSSAIDEIEYEASVRVESMCPDGTVWAGTGWAISNKTVITAGHVVTCSINADGNMVDVDPIAIIVVTIDNEPIGVDLDKRAADADAARLIISGEGQTFKHWLPTSTDAIKTGQELCSIGGDAAGFYAIKKCGYVGPTDSSGGGYLSIHIVPGNSGSAVINNHGYVIGMLVKGRWDPRTEFVGYIIPTESFKDLL